MRGYREWFQKALLAAMMAAALVFTAAPIASAADPTANIVPEKRAAIDELVQVTNMRNMLDQITTQFVGAMSKMISPQNPGKEKDIGEILTRHFTEVFHQHQQDFLDMAYLTYDKYMTLDDIKATVEFYKTPAGQHVIKAMPKVAQDMAGAGMLLGQRLYQEALPGILDDLKSHGIKTQA
jgi:hypothetical protein